MPLDAALYHLVLMVGWSKMKTHLALYSQSTKSGEKVTRRRAPFSTINNDFRPLRFNVSVKNNRRGLAEK